MESPRRPSLLSLWDLLAVAGFAGLWAFYTVLLPSLPDPVPTHFDALGAPNGWTPKSALPWVIFGLPLLIWAFTTGLGLAMALAQADPARARAVAMAPLRGLLGLGLAWLMAFCLLTPTCGPGILFIGLGGFLGLLIAGLVFVVREFRQAGAAGASQEDYRWGLFYVNAEDPRIFVDKPIGVGWTLNFARPASWGVLALMLLPVAVIILLTRH